MDLQEERGYRIGRSLVVRSDSHDFPAVGHEWISSSGFIVVRIPFVSRENNLHSTSRKSEGKDVLGKLATIATCTEDLAFDRAKSEKEMVHLALED